MRRESHLFLNTRTCPALPETAPDRFILGFLFVTVLSAGCTQTTMLPAHQLDRGKTVSAVTVDEPGILHFPRGTVQVTHGAGYGDLTANLSGPPLRGGLTGRYYLSTDANAEVQVQASSYSGKLNVLGLLGLQEVPTGDDSWYVGGQVGAINDKRPAQSHARGGTGGHTPSSAGPLVYPVRARVVVASVTRSGAKRADCGDPRDASSPRNAPVGRTLPALQITGSLLDNGDKRYCSSSSSGAPFSCRPRMPSNVFGFRRLSTRPYSFASSALIQKLRSASFSICS